MNAITRIFVKTLTTILKIVAGEFEAMLERFKNDHHS
jgi:hypothetical protein